MQLINKNGKIYLRFKSSYKVISRSLGLEYNDKNLKFCYKKLMPVFQKISNINEFKNTKFSSEFTKNSQSKHKKIDIQKIKIPAKPYLFSHFCAIYVKDLTLKSKISSLKTAISAINRLFDFIDDKALKHYKNNDFMGVIALMQKENLSNATINLLLSYPNMVFKKAILDGFITTNPLSNVKKPIKFSKPKHCFTKEQIKLLLNATDGELQTFLYIAFYTGARSGEILALCKQDFDFEADKINITKNKTRFELTTPKNGKPRTINLLKPLKEYILSLDLQHGKIFSKDYFQIYYEFKKILALLGLPPRGLHTTRHSFCSLLIANNISPTLVAHTLGHSNLDMVNKVYAHFLENKSDLKNLNNAMKL